MCVGFGDPIFRESADNIDVLYMVDSGVMLVWGTGNGGGCEHSSRYEHVAVHFGAAAILELFHTLEQNY